VNCVQERGHAGVVAASQKKKRPVKAKGSEAKKVKFTEPVDII
jgi:hypothetical protein